MKKICAGLLAMTLTTPWLAFGQAKQQQAAPSKNGSVEQELINLDKQCNEACIKGDAAFFDRILADDYTDTDTGGSVSTKAQDLADLKSGDLKIISQVCGDYMVRVYGNAAVLTCRGNIKGQFKGADISGEYRCTETWIKFANGWQCVAEHSSKIAEKK